MDKQENKPTLEIGSKPLSEDKYFTPSIEDIRVGYEGEYQYKPNDWRWFRIEDSGELCDTWETEHGELYLMQMDKYKWLRVPYLTKEQIEKEGWICYKDKTKFIGDNGRAYQWEFYKEGKTIIFRDDVYQLSMYILAGRERIAFCKCPSINEFRLINKLTWI